MLRLLRSKLAAACAVLAGVAGPAVAQPAATSTWNNFIGTGTLWSNAAAWLPATAPSPSNVDNVLWFGSSQLQSAGGYTTTYANAGGAFDVNSLVFNSFAASNPSLVVTGSAVGDTLRFNTSTGLVLPSIWQIGTGRVVIQNGTGAGIALNNGTTLQILGNGIGELQLTANIVQTGAGNSGLFINQTGTRAFNTGSVIRLGSTLLPTVNTFAGGVNITAGNVLVGVNSAFGTGTVTVNGGTIQPDPATTVGLAVANNFTLNSTLVVTGNNNLSATGNLFNLQFGGVLSGTGGLTIAPNAGNLNSGTFATQFYGLFNSGNNFSGPVTIAPTGNTSAVLYVGGAGVGAGTISGSTAISLNWSGVIRIDNSTAVVTRLNTVTPPTVSLGGNTTLLMAGNSTANSTETFGALTATGGAALQVLANITTAQTTTANFPSWNRPTNGSLFITATNLGSGSGGVGTAEAIITVGTNPGDIGGGGAAGTPTVNILPYAVANYGTTINGTTNNVVSGFVRYDSGTQRIVPLNTATEYLSNLYLPTQAVAGANQRLASTTGLPNAFSVVTPNTPLTANSLVLDTSTAATNLVAVALSSPSTVNVTGGAIFSTVNSGTGGPVNPSVINAAALAFGNTPAYIHTFASLTVNAPITGSGGVYKAAGGTLTLTAANTFTGGLTVNAGLVQFFNDNQLGAAGGSVTLQGGSGGGLQYLPPTLWTNATTNTLTSARPITVNPAGGSITVTALNTNLTLSGPITGSGQVFKLGAGALTLTGDNSGFSGYLIPFGGVIAFQDDNAIGGPSATINLTNGAIQPLTSFTTAKDMFLSASIGTIYTGGQNLTVTGNITSQNAAPTLVKTGLGDLIITSTITTQGSFQNGFSSPASVVFPTTGAGVQTSGRTILSGANGAMPLASGVLSIAGGEVVLDNTAAVNNNRVGSVTVSLIGGNFTLKGNASAPVLEEIGAFSFNNANNPYGGVITIDTPAGSGQTTTLKALSLSALTNGGTLFLRASALGAPSGERSILILTTATGLTNNIIPTLVGATSAAAADATTFLGVTTIVNPAPNSSQSNVVPFTGYIAGGTLGTGSASATYDVTTPTTFTGAGLANALRLNGGGTLGIGTTLTLTAGTILSTGGVATTISGGTLAFGANPARFVVAAGADVTVSSATTGSAGIIKTGNGVLTLNTASAITVTAGTSFYGVGAGTLRYGVNNALPTTTNVFVNAGGTLDINNTTSTVGNLNGYGNVALGATGTLTVGSITQITTFGGAFSGGAGSTLIKSTATIVTSIMGDSTAGFTGGVQVLGGTLGVNTSGALGSGTSPILLGNTTGTVQALLTLGGQVSSFSRDITVQAGSTPATPHALGAPAGVSTISSNIIINNTVGLRLTGTTGTAGGNANLTGVISGAGPIVIFSGNWSFNNGGNTYAGGTTVDTNTGGAIGIGANSTPTTGTVTSGPLGTGTITVSSFGSHFRADGGPRTLANNLVFQSGAFIATAGSNPLTFNGTVNLSAAAATQTFTIQNTAVTTYNGVISNSTNGITKNGPGVLAFGGANTYTGATVVNAGVLRAVNSTGSAVGGATLTVNPGARVDGTGFIGVTGVSTVDITLGTGGAAIAGGVNGVGTLTFNGGFNAVAGSVLVVGITAPGLTAAISTGGSTTGTAPSPTGNNYLNKTGGASPSGLASLTLSVDLNGITFPTLFVPYSYVVAGGFGTQGPGGANLNVTAPSQFSIYNYSDPNVTFANVSFTGDDSGFLYVNFTPAPEPMVMFGAAALGVLALRRRKA